MRARLYLALFLASGSAAFSQAAPTAPQPTPKGPRAILAAAAPFHDFNDPSLKPWHLKATHQLYDENVKPAQQGTYECRWASPKADRSTWFVQMQATPSGRGRSSVDFDLTWKNLNPTDNTAVLVVRHVPPDKSEVPLPAAWMRTPVADTPNNWVQVVKLSGKYMALVGQETFAVEMKISLTDGRILSASMDNPVKIRMRVCDDEALTQCAAPQPHEIVRKIQIELQK